VRGIVERQKYSLEHGSGSNQHIVVPEADHAPSALAEAGGSRRIVLLSVNATSTIEFHDQPALRRCEISEIGADRMLSPEFDATESTIAKVVPQQTLRIRFSAAKLACPCCRCAPHPSPLPARGERELEPRPAFSTSSVRLIVDRQALPCYLYARRIRSDSRCASFIACSGVLLPVSAACNPSFNAFVTRWLSCVDNSAFAYGS
jgi:hypothetical protein